MEIIRGLDFKIRESAVTLGKFEGIHRGHRLLLDTVLEQKEWQPTVFTFDHILSGERLYSDREQSLILEKMGIARKLVFPFSDQTRSMTAEQFVEQILIEKMDTKFICVGEDFRFGKNRQGDVELLQRLSGSYGYSLRICPKLKEGGEVISSTRIRQELQKGSIEQVNRLLGEPYFISGKVVHGKELGRRMDMPTANILPEPDKLLPRYGVYAVTVETGGQVYGGVANLGRRPTVGGKQVNLETTLLRFTGNLYGRDILVSFCAFLRPEKKFEDIGRLKEQLQRDKEQAEKILQRDGLIKAEAEQGAF